MKNVFLILALTAVVLQATSAGSISGNINGSFDAGANGNGGLTGGIVIGSEARADGYASINDANAASLFADIFAGSGDLGSDIISSYQNATKSGQETAKNFVDNVESSTKIFKEQAEAYAQAVGDAVDSALQQGVIGLTSSVQALKLNLNGQIQSLENRVKRGVLTEFEKALIKVNASALALQNIATAVNTRYDTQITEEQTNILKTWQQFTTDALTKVSEQTEDNAYTKKKVTEVLNEYQERYGNYLSSCSNEAKKDATAYSRKVQSVIQLYQAVVQQVIVEVEACLASDDNNSSNNKCRADTRKALANIGKASPDFENQIKIGASLLSTNYQRRSCVVRTLVEYKLESYAIQRKIDQYVDDYKQITGKSDGDD